MLAAATPRRYGDPLVIDETLQLVDPEQIQPGDVVGIGIHTSNALRGYELGRMARERGAYVVFGGIHATLHPHEAHELGAAHSVVKGDGDVIWASVLSDCAGGQPQAIYEAGQIEPEQFLAARWDLMPPGSYMFGSVQTVRGCPKHCSFCSVWRTDGQRPRQRASDGVVEEIVELRRMGFRFVVLADDNFYPVTLTDLKLAEQQGNQTRLAELRQIRADRFELMARLAALPSDMVFFTQITMEAAEDGEFLDAMRHANIKGALVGVESVTEEGLKAVYKEFNCAGESLVNQLRAFGQHGVHVLGSFIFGLPTDKRDTFEATVSLAQRADVAFAQFVMMTPYPGTVDFMRWQKARESDPTRIGGFPLTRYWLIPRALRPRTYSEHPAMSHEQIRQGTQYAWDRFYNLRSIWRRSGTCTRTLKARLAFLLISKLYRQMYANTGIATDSARISRAARWARWIAKPCQRWFQAPPMPQLQVPVYPLPSSEI